MIPQPPRDMHPACAAVGRFAFRQTRRQARREGRLGSDSGGPADLSKFEREVRLLAGVDVRYLALATISLAEVVAA